MEQGEKLASHPAPNLPLRTLSTAKPSIDYAGSEAQAQETERNASFGIFIKLFWF